MRVALFIDGNYLYQNAKKLLGRKPSLDLNKVRDGLAGFVNGRALMRCYYYDATPALSSPPTVSEQARYDAKKGFLSALSHLPYFQTRVGYCKYIEIGGEKRLTQKKVDVLLAVDLVQMSMQQSITDAVVVAGDGDFMPAIKIAKTAGVCVHLVHDDIASSELVGHADTRTPLTKEMLLGWEKEIAPIAKAIAQVKARIHP